MSVELPHPIPDATAAAAYFAVSELLANVAKHAGAELVRIELRQPPSMLEIRVVDDGRGGADPEGRSNAAISATLNLSTSAVTKHIAAIFDKLDLVASGHDNRRVLAVLEFLRG